MRTVPWTYRILSWTHLSRATPHPTERIILRLTSYNPLIPTRGHVLKPKWPVRVLGSEPHQRNPPTPCRGGRRHPRCQGKQRSSQYASAALPCRRDGHTRRTSWKEGAR